MTSGIHLLALIGPADSFWPSLTGVLHWHRVAGPLLRLCIAHPADPRHPGGGAASILERVARAVCPGLRIERRELDSAPDALRRQFEQWQKDAPDASWVIQLASESPAFAWSLEALTPPPGCRVIQRLPSGDWIELTPPNPEASEAPQETPLLPTFRREELDELSIADLVRAQAGDAAVSAVLSATPAQPLQIASLLQAAIAASWAWKQAYQSTGLDPGSDSENVLFQRFLGALLLDLGLHNVVHGYRRPRSTTLPPTSTDPLLWINHGGRLTVIDARLGTSEGMPDSIASPDSGESPLGQDILKAIQERRDLGALWPEWILVRPCHAITLLEQHLAEAHGIRVFDETVCRDLPARIAALFFLPLSPDVVEVERRLRTHVAETGRTRVFGPESTLLQQQRAAASDPVIVHTDGLLEQIQRARGQNWLLWTHQERTYLRVPAEGRSSASGDWRAMLAAFVGIDIAQVQARQNPRVVLIDFPDSPENRKRVADWVRPFLNASLTFDTARARFAAEARVTAEAASAGRNNPRTPAMTVPPPASPPSSPVPIPSSQRTTPPLQPAKTTPSRPAAPAAPAPRRMQRVSLEDLDRALDNAFTPSPEPTPSPDPGPGKP